jgi:hypothetical protein
VRPPYEHDDETDPPVLAPALPRAQFAGC